MTDDDLYARFDEIVSGEELSDLQGRGKKPRRGWLYRASQILLLAVLLLVSAGGVWFLIRVAVWFGQHGMLPAPN